MLSKDIKRVLEVNFQAEQFYKDAVRLGDHAAHAFRDLSSDSKRSRHRAQMTSLENIAESAFKTSDVFNYVKRQIARFDYWRKGYSENPDPNMGFGEVLRKYLEEDIAT